MPKERRGRSVSSNRSRTSPYPCSSSHAMQSSSKNSLEPLEEVKEWEEARCPVCMEHPHNAVLLLCSSHEKGCRPYMCDTSYRHSNCLDQFRKAFEETPSTLPQEETSLSITAPHTMTSEATQMDLQEERSEGALPVPTVPCENQVQPKLVCPLCRGQVNSWIVVKPARQFMNTKARSCACETCEYSGTYADLRKHARLVHPLVRPSEADPERQRDWRMLERERDLGDVLSTIQSAFGEERPEDSAITANGNLLTVLIFFRVSRVSLSASGARSSWSSPSRSRGQSRSRRRTLRAATLWGESYETETGSATREGENASSEDVPASWRRLDRNRRWTMPDDEP